MVHPLMRQTKKKGDPARSEDADSDPKQISEQIIDMLPRLHVVVIGPGLGRDPLMHDTLGRVLSAARDQLMPVVLDADALMIVQKHPELVKGNKSVVLTPNVVEFRRLCEALKVDVGSEASETAKVEALATALDGVTVVQKGGRDYISNGKTTLAVDLQGGKKRSGGQGDTLTGSIATFLAWRKAYLERLWDVGKDPLDEDEMVGLAAFGGCCITKVSLLCPETLCSTSCGVFIRLDELHANVKTRSALAWPFRREGVVCKLVI